MKAHCELKDLFGVKAKSVDAVFFKRAAKIETILSNNMAATAADYNGALNIWKDDEGKIRCEAFAHYKAVDNNMYSSIPPAIKWAKKWLKKIK